MIDLGTVKPGSTIRIPFSSFDKDDGSSITMTNYAAADILVYKDGSTTERASTSGYTATTDFDGKTGKHLAIIDLSDNTTAGFWNAGSEYLVAIDAVTVDGVTTGGWIARFKIGYPNAILDTTIATLSSQTSFTLTNGPAEDDALNGFYAIIHDIASAVQLSRVLILDYTGSTKTVTLVAGATFTAAAGDNISVMDMAPLQPTTQGRTLDVTSTGAAGIDWGNVENQGTTVGLSATTVATVTTTTTATNLTNAPTSGDLTATMKASVNTEIDAALAEIHLDHLIASADPGSIVADSSFLAKLTSKSATPAFSSYNNTTDSLEALRDNTGTAGAGLTAIDLPDQTMTITGNLVGNVTGSVNEVIGNVGGSVASVLGNISGNLSGSVGSLAAGAQNDVTNATTSALTSYQPTMNAEVRAGLVVAQGTIGATGNTTTTLHLTGLTYGDDEINDYMLVILDVSANEYHIRWVDDWADTGDLATVATLPFTPQNSTDQYWILPLKREAKSSDLLLVKAKTDNLPSDPADASVVAGLIAAVEAKVDIVDTNVDSILADTGTDGVVVAAASKTGYTLTTADKQALIELYFTFDATATYATADAGSLVKQIADNSGGSGLSVQDIVNGVWNEDATGHQTQGSFGQAIGDPGSDSDTIWALVNTNLNATVSSRSSHSAADVWAVATRVLTAGTNIVLAKGSGVTGFTDLNATQVENAVWDALKSNHTTADSFGDYLDDEITSRMATFTLPTNFADLAITASTGRVTVGTNADKTGYSITGTTTTLDALQTALNSAHGAGSWATATGFSTHSAADVWASATRTLTSLAGLTVDTVTTVTTTTNLTNLPAITTGWITAAGVSAAAANKLADHSIRRTQANVEASSDGDTLALGSLYGFIQMAQESSTEASAGFLTVYKTDGTTSLGTKQLSTDADAEPITRIQ